MPTEASHKEFAARNEILGAALESSYPDWSVTALFYSALHFTRAWLKNKGYSDDDFKTHTDAEEALALADFCEIFAYKELFALSLTMRYKCPTEHQVALSLAEAKAAHKAVKECVQATWSP